MRFPFRDVSGECSVLGMMPPFCLGIKEGILHIDFFVVLNQEQGIMSAQADSLWFHHHVWIEVVSKLQCSSPTTKKE